MSLGALGSPGVLSSAKRGKLVVYLGREPKEGKTGDPPPEAGRDTHEAIVVCKSPDVCKTPVGAATPPIPYQITSKLGDDVNTAPSVRFTKLRAFKFNSHTTHVTGDEPGTAKGVKSGTVGDIAEPKTHSESVKTEKQWLIRDGDEFYMNRRNTTGDVLYKKNRKKAPPQDWHKSKIDDSEAEALIARAKAEGWQIEYVQTNQIKRESAYIQKGGSSTMVAQAGAMTMGGGSILSDAPAFKLPSGLTQVPSGALKGAGTAASAAGKILFILWIVQGAPMPGENRILAEGSAKEALKGLEPQDAYEQGLYDKAKGALTDYKAGVYDSLLPTGATKYDEETRKALQDAYTLHRAEKKAKEETQTDAGAGKKGGRITGDPCGVGPHKEGCPDNLDSHHVVADMVLRWGPRGDTANRIANAPSLDEGPTMCLTKEEHKKVHEIMRQKFADLSKNSAGPAGTAPISEIIEESIKAMGEVKPGCKGKFEDKVRKEFKDIKDGELGRLRQKPFAKKGDLNFTPPTAD